MSFRSLQSDLRSSLLKSPPNWFRLYEIHWRNHGWIKPSLCVLSQRSNTRAAGESSLKELFYSALHLTTSNYKHCASCGCFAIKAFLVFQPITFTAWYHVLALANPSFTPAGGLEWEEKRSRKHSNCTRRGQNFLLCVEPLRRRVVTM